MSEDQLESFLREGVSTYRRAFDTVRFFESEMESRLERILRSKRDWEGFVPESKKAAIETGHGHREGIGCWIYAALSGSSPTGVQVVPAIGLWWGAPRASFGHDVIMYANLGPVEIFGDHPFVSATAGVLAIPHKVGLFSRLYMAPPADLDLDRDFGLLLRELDRHCAGACGCAGSTAALTPTPTIDALPPR